MPYAIDNPQDIVGPENCRMNTQAFQLKLVKEQEIVGKQGAIFVHSGTGRNNEAL